MALLSYSLSLADKANNYIHISGAREHTTFELTHFTGNATDDDNGATSLFDHVREDCLGEGDGTDGVEF